MPPSSATTTAAPTSPKKSKSLPSSTIAGISVASSLGLLGLAAISFALYRRHNRKARSPEGPLDGMAEMPGGEGPSYEAGGGGIKVEIGGGRKPRQELIGDGAHHEMLGSTGMEAQELDGRAVSLKPDKKNSEDFEGREEHIGARELEENFQFAPSPNGEHSEP